MITTPEIISYIAATLTTASFVPQAILTIKTRDTESLSLGMYSSFTLGVLCWLIYGVFLGDKSIIFANSITLLLSSSILFFKLYTMVRKQKPK